MFQPWNPLGNNSIVPSHSNYNGKHSTGSNSSKRGSTRRKSRNLSKKEREKIARDAVHKSKTGAYIPFPTAVSPYADGGLVNKTTLSYVGEDGPEANLLQLLRAQKGQVSDELCSIIADAVEGAYKNIPVA